MRTGLVLGATACIAAVASPGSTVFAQMPAVAPTPPIAESGVTSYPPSYFAEFRPTTAMSMIGNIPGFSFDSGGSARGQSTNVGNVLIDGRRPPAGNDDLSAILSRIPADSVERIDVIRGGAPGIDMMGKPIVANVIRKRTANVSGAASLSVNLDLRGEVNHSFSMNAQRQANGRTLDGSIETFEGGGQNQSVSLRVAPNGSLLRETRARNQFKFTRSSANAAYETPLLGGNLRVNGQYGAERSRGVSTTLIAPGGAFGSENRGEDSNSEIGARYSRTLGGVRFETVVLHQRTQNESTFDFSEPGITQFTTNFRKTGQSVLTQTVALPARGAWTLTGGAEAAYNWFTTSSADVINGTLFPVAGSEQDQDELRLEAFATANWAPNPRFSAQFGLRVESSTMAIVTESDDREQSFFYAKPRINVSWRPRTGHEITSTLQLTVNQLSFNDFATSVSASNDIVVIANTGLEPEKAWSLESRYVRTWGRRGNFTAQHTYRYVENPIASTLVAVITPDDPATPANEFRRDFFDLRANIDASHFNQLRLSGNVPLEPFGLKDTYFDGAVTLRHSVFIDPVTLHSRRNGGEAAWDWNLGVSREYNQARFVWRFGLNGRADTIGYGPRTQNFNFSTVSANAGITWRPDDKWVMNASVNGNFGEQRNRSIQFIGSRADGVVRYTNFNVSEPTPRVSLSVRRAL